jgi:hypothetical protein
VAEQQENLGWERAMESAPRLDGRTDDQELRSTLRRDARDFIAEAPRPRTDDLPPHTDAVGGRDGGGQIEPLPDAHELSVEVRVERQLALKHGGCDEDDSGAAVGGEPAREVDRMLRLGVVEQWDDDGAVRDRPGPAREAARATMERSDVGKSHRSS